MRILITGTTSGLGKAFAQYYLKQGHEVIAVNRRESTETRNGQMCHVLDITDRNKVLALLELLKDSQTIPDIFILNAGINRPDHTVRFDFDTYHTSLETNLMGVMTFVAAIQDLQLKSKKVVCVSSTSNIVPNPGHMGYYISKLALHETFKLLRRRDAQNDYKTIILGPVHTNIMSGYAGPQGIQGKIFDILAVSAETAALACTEFISSSRKVFYYTKPACLFYWAVRMLLKVMPGLYVGTLPAAKNAPAVSRSL